MNRTQFGLTVPHLSREEKGDQQLCQKPLLCMLIALSGRELYNISSLTLQNVKISFGRPRIHVTSRGKHDRLVKLVDM